MNLQRMDDDAAPPWEAPEGYVDPNQPVDGEEPEAEDPLAGLTDEQRTYFEAQITERENALRTQLRGNLQQVGIDLTQDGQPAIRDRQAVGYWAGPAMAAPEQQNPHPAPTPPQSPLPEVGEAPDYYEDPKGFAAYIERLVAARAAEAVRPLQEELTRSRETGKRAQIATAFREVGNAIETYVPELAYLLDHPEFAERFQQVLVSTDPQYWADNQNLAVLASTLRVAMPPPRAPVEAEPAVQPVRGARQQTPRLAPATNPRQPATPTGQSAARAQLSRAAVGQASPTRGEGRAQTPREYDPVILEAASRLNISPEEVMALSQDTTGDASASYRSKRLQQIRGGR